MDPLVYLAKFLVRLPLIWTIALVIAPLVIGLSITLLYRWRMSEWEWGFVILMFVVLSLVVISSLVAILAVMVISIRFNLNSAEYFYLGLLFAMFYPAVLLTATFRIINGNGQAQRPDGEPKLPERGVKNREDNKGQGTFVPCSPELSFILLSGLIPLKKGENPNRLG